MRHEANADNRMRAGSSVVGRYQGAWQTEHQIRTDVIAVCFETNTFQVLFGEAVSVGPVVCQRQSPCDEIPAQSMVYRASAHAHEEQFAATELCSDRPSENV